jgi:hypothetical protein
MTFPWPISKYHRKKFGNVVKFIQLEYQVSGLCSKSEASNYKIRMLTTKHRYFAPRK